MIDQNIQRVDLAVLLTCHNRKDKTLSCLKSLSEQVDREDGPVQVYLVDDASTDGTAEAVTRQFGDVHLLQGDGTLFWNGGMRKAFQTASEKGYDYYLWLNDDTELLGDALDRLLSIAREYPGAIIVGSTLDLKQEKHTYGGVLLGPGMSRLRFSQIVPHTDSVLPCDTFNGNCVLIPREVFNVIGNLSTDFTHGMGDFDYGLRAKQAGFESLVAPGYYGLCDPNQPPRCFDQRQSLFSRLKILHSPKGLPPAEWMRFTRRHAPFVWPFYILMLYFRVIFPR